MGSVIVISCSLPAGSVTPGSSPDSASSAPRFGRDQTAIPSRTSRQCNDYELALG